MFYIASTDSPQNKNKKTHWPDRPRPHVAGGAVCTCTQKKKKEWNVAFLDHREVRESVNDKGHVTHLRGQSEHPLIARAKCQESELAPEWRRWRVSVWRFSMPPCVWSSLIMLFWRPEEASSDPPDSQPRQSITYYHPDKQSFFVQSGAGRLFGRHSNSTFVLGLFHIWEYSMYSNILWFHIKIPSNFSTFCSVINGHWNGPNAQKYVCVFFFLCVFFFSKGWAKVWNNLGIKIQTCEAWWW